MNSEQHRATIPAEEPYRRYRTVKLILPNPLKGLPTREDIAVIMADGSRIIAFKQDGEWFERYRPQDQGITPPVSYTWTFPHHAHYISRKDSEPNPD